MKAVAGTVRLELAQYRELEAFAQFGSDLDKASQQQIARGQRVVEILKQRQFQPLSVDLQVASIVAVTGGYIDDVPVGDVSRFESELHEFLQTRHAGVLDRLRTEKFKGGLDDELKGAIEAFKDSFQATEQAEVVEENEGWDAMAASSETVED
jgi:F-type H+/Na+-transporting ATPase subunit alpha